LGFGVGGKTSGFRFKVRRVSGFRVEVSGFRV
jgi:hypothetical protein